MGTKMFMLLMVTRLPGRLLIGATLCAALFAVSACDKVPLLAPSGSTITLTVTATALPLNGTTQIVAQVLEASGTPPQDGTLIVFTTSMGSVQPPEAQTKGGRATVTFNAGTTNGTATITASSGGASASGANAAKVAIGTAAVGSVRVSANPTLLPALGGSSTITAVVIDINGNPLSSAPVSFSTTAGSLDQGAATTDQNGAAAAILRTSTSATVTAAVGAQAGSSTTTPPATGTPATPTTPATTGTASGTVTVNVAGAPTLTITPPATIPSAGLPASFTFAVAVPATNGSAIRDVTVDWGDGRTQDLGVVTASTSVSHTYQSDGTYLIVGTVTDSFGNVVKNSISVAVNPKPQPTVSIVATTTNPTAGTDMTFTASVAPVAGNGTVIRSVSVDFGDGTTTPLGAVTGTTIALHHVYLAGGTYTATLTATDSNGGVGQAATTVFVQTATPLTVLLSSTSTPAGANTAVTFTATVIGLGNAVVVDYQWDLPASLETRHTTSNTTTKTYAAGTGTITVTVTITTSTGARQSGQTTLIIP
jgi:adhesin/invasin